MSNRKGKITKILSKNSRNFEEVYLSHVKYNSIKAWKKHSLENINLTVIKGKVKFVFYEQKKNSFQNIILSVSSHLSNKKEIIRKDLNEIKFNWK